MIIEFSIGLAGFSGIVAALLQTKSGLRGADRFRTINLLILALSPGFVSLTSLIFLNRFGNIELIWNASLFMLAVLIVVMTVSSHVQLSKLDESEKQVTTAGSTVIAIVVVTIFLVAASGIFSFDGFTSFVLGATFMLLLGVTQFVRLIFIRPSTRGDGS